MTVRKGGIHERPWGVCLEQNNNASDGATLQPLKKYQSGIFDNSLNTSEYDQGWAGWATGDVNNSTSIHQMRCPEGAKIVALEAYDQEGFGLINLRFGYITSDNEATPQWSEWATENFQGIHVGPVSVPTGDYATGIQVHYRQTIHLTQSTEQTHDYGIVNACLVYSQDSTDQVTGWVGPNPDGAVMRSFAPTDGTYMMTGLQCAHEDNHGLVDVNIAYAPVPTSS